MPAFATGWKRFVPVVGYHHVLMILIAIAIVLLCKYYRDTPIQQDADSFDSTTTSRVLLDIASNTRHLPNIPILSTVPSHLLHSSSRPCCHYSNSKHSRQCQPQRPSRLLRSLHTRRRRRMDVQPECNRSCRSGDCG